MIKNIMLSSVVAASLILWTTSITATHDDKIHFISNTTPFVINYINYNENQRTCLALNIYYEARSQSIKGQIAVGLVTLNRVASNKYPNNICDVVKQGKNWKGNPIRNRCQFSWWCDGKSDRPHEQLAWKASIKLANTIIDEYIFADYDVTNGSLWYHASYVKPKWAAKLAHTVVIDDHLFYAPNP